MSPVPCERATVCFPDGTRSLVPLYIVYRSPVLYDSLAHASVSEGDDAVIYAPRTFFHSWLECAELLSKRPTTSLRDAETERLLKYLLVRGITGIAYSSIVNILKCLNILHTSLQFNIDYRTRPRNCHFRRSTWRYVPSRKLVDRACAFGEANPINHRRTGFQCEEIKTHIYTAIHRTTQHPS
jgi:hypothetical protein